jgi:hypothetical protein
MRKFNPFRSKMHHEPAHQPKITTSRFTAHGGFPATVNADRTVSSTPPITISAPIINSADKVIIIDKDQPEENPNEEQTSVIDNDNIDEQTVLSEETETLSGEYTHLDDQVD